jgi:hypothetical protein
MSRPTKREVEEHNRYELIRYAAFRRAADAVTAAFAAVPEVRAVTLFGSVARPLEKSCRTSPISDATASRLSTTARMWISPSRSTGSTTWPHTTERAVPPWQRSTHPTGLAWLITRSTSSCSAETGAITSDGYAATAGAPRQARMLRSRGVGASLCCGSTRASSCSPMPSPPAGASRCTSVDAAFCAERLRSTMSARAHLTRLLRPPPAERGGSPPRHARGRRGWRMPNRRPFQRSARPARRRARRAAGKAPGCA